MDFTAETAETAGITMEYLEQGEGTAVLLLHVFPEHPYRALRKDWEEGQGLDYVIDKPALMISASDDWFFLAGATDGMRNFSG